MWYARLLSRCHAWATSHHLWLEDASHLRERTQRSAGGLWNVWDVGCGECMLKCFECRACKLNLCSIRSSLSRVSVKSAGNRWDSRIELPKDLVSSFQPHTSGRKAAMGLLEALDFEKLTAEAATAEPEAKAAGAGASKKAKKPEWLVYRSDIFSNVCPLTSNSVVQVTPSLWFDIDLSIEQNLQQIIASWGQAKARSGMWSQLTRDIPMYGWRHGAPWFVRSWMWIMSTLCRWEAHLRGWSRADDEGHPKDTE